MSLKLFLFSLNNVEEIKIFIEFLNSIDNLSIIENYISDLSLKLNDFICIIRESNILDIHKDLFISIINLFFRLDFPIFLFDFYISLFSIYSFCLKKKINNSMSEKRMNDLLNYKYPGFLINENNPQILNLFIDNLFSQNFFNLIKLKKFDLDLHIKYINLILIMESFLSDQAFLALIKFQKYILLDHKISVYSELFFNQVLNFFEKFHQLFQDSIEEIISFLIEIIFDQNFQITSSIINSLLSIIENAELHDSSEKLKNILFLFLIKNSEPAQLIKIYNFLPELSIKTHFNESDIIKLLCHSNSLGKFVSKSIIKIIQNSQIDINIISTHVISCGVFSSELYLFLIEKTDNHKISKSLFNQLFQNENNFFHKKHIGNKFKIFFEKLFLTNKKKTEEIIQFLLKFFNYEIFQLFIEKTYDTWYLSYELEKNIEKIIYLLDINEYEKLIIYLFNLLINLNFKRFNYQIGESISSIIIFWINYFQFIPEIIINRLIEIEYNKLPSFIFQIISIILKYILNHNLYKQILQKIIFDTIPYYANNSIIPLFLNEFKDDKKTIIKTLDLFNRYLFEKDKLNNIINMIIFIGEYESDFFEINLNNTFSQKFIFNFQNQDFEFSISFHPFNTTRKIYYFIF